MTVVERSPWHQFSGVRLPRKASPPVEQDDIADPAKGEPVRRCRVCGMPERTESRILAGVWTRGTFAIALSLCERCVNAIAPFDPRSGDPLEAA